MIELKLRDAELAGVGLTGEKKARFNAIQEELAKLSRQFGQNVLDATKAFELLLTTHSDVAGLPRSALAQAAERARKSHPQGLPRNEAALYHIVVAAAATAENGPWLVTLDGPSFVAFMTFAEHRGHREKLYLAYQTRSDHMLPSFLDFQR